MCDLCNLCDLMFRVSKWSHIDNQTNKCDLGNICDFSKTAYCILACIWCYMYTLKINLKIKDRNICDLCNFMITVCPYHWPLMDGQIQPKGTLWSNAGNGYQMERQTDKHTETNLFLAQRPGRVKFKKN